MEANKHALNQPWSHDPQTEYIFRGQTGQTKEEDFHSREPGVYKGQR